MEIWTTFSPQKICWEITTVKNKGKGGDSNWLANKTIIEESLMLLKQSGITGIRLVIFPSELTDDGKKFHWQPIETMLSFCKKQQLLVDLCIGPFQYPYYPGIYLPNDLSGLLSEKHSIDSLPFMKAYGIQFIRLQMEKYGDDDRIHGFHFANEWPDRQVVSGNESIKVGISKKYMIELAILLKQSTKKPISMNTNIDASSTAKLQKVFYDIFAILGKQGRLGFDIYPSQETWTKTPVQKLKRLFEKYVTSFTQIGKNFAPCEIYFAEVEAQPWGDGRSWYAIIKSQQNPKEQILSYSPDSLQKTWNNHILGTPCQTISLWGADFWLAAHELKLQWPLQKLQTLSTSA